MNRQSLFITRVKEKFSQWKTRYSEWREKKQLFLIYSMGKVGTTTVYSLIKNQYPEYPIIQVHFMSEHLIKSVIPTWDPELHCNILIAQKAYELIDTHPNHRLKIISMIREPMAREISNIFENSKALFHVDSIDLSFSQLKEYLDKCDHQYALNWFDSEFKSYVGFNIYNHSFNKRRGYSIYRARKADILIIRTENINASLVEAVCKFCGLKLELSDSANTIEQKQGKELYYKLKEEYDLSLEKLKLLYKSRLVRHFYTHAEIDGFVRRWSHGKLNIKNLRQ